MLRSVKEITGYILLGTDDEIGRCRDFLFEDQHWAVRYMVAETGKWLPGQKVLISPISLGEPEWNSRRFPVDLTKDQIKNSPPLEHDMPVSREYEARYFDYYGYPYYWVGGGLWGVEAYPTGLLSRRNEQFPEEKAVRQNNEPNHLRSCGEVEGYHIEATDDSIGHVEDFIVEEDSWIIRYAVIDTRNWLPGGKKVVISPSWVKAVIWNDEKVVVDLTKDQIKNSPEFDPSTPINREYEAQLYDFYGRPRYW